MSIKSDSTSVPATYCDFVWQGRTDIEDAELGTRVHHIVKSQQAANLTEHSDSVSILASPLMQAWRETKVVSGPARAQTRFAKPSLIWHGTTTLLL